MLSSFTLISVIGVMLGVLVLVVVMAVFSGLERQVKERILGFTPHILVQDTLLGSEGLKDGGWERIASRVQKLEQVESATPHISDHVIMDVASWQRPVKFHAIDSYDTSQIQGVTDMLDMKGHPESTADLGIDDRAVISSTLAEQYGIGVGAIIRLYSTRNFEEVMQAYKSTEDPPLREAWSAQWKMVTDTFGGEWKLVGDQPSLSVEAALKAQDQIFFIIDQNIRVPERELLYSMLDLLKKNMVKKDEETGIFLFEPGTSEKFADLIQAVESTDPEKMDADILKGMKSFVLPKELEVVGVYMASQMAMTPDLFVPLHIGQDLAGLEDAVQGVALRLEDAYMAEEIAIEARELLGDNWNMVTWGEEYRPFFLLMAQQRMMMYFALSFIVLVSAFSMMAVMFTVTIQKKREIGVMKALGAAPGQIVRVFLYQGMLLGAIGSLIGIGLGHVVIHFRGGVQAFMRTLGFDPFSASLTGFDTLPAHHNPLEQALIGFSAFVLCSIAALVPAFFAARSDAAKSLRNL